MENYPVIDIHTHIFNTHFVPIVDIIHCKFHQPLKIAKLLGNILNEATGMLPVSGTKEHPMLHMIRDKKNSEEEITRQVIETVKRAVVERLQAKTKEETSSKIASSGLYKSLNKVSLEPISDIPSYFPVCEVRNKAVDALTMRPSLEEEIIRIQELNNFIEDWVGKKLFRLLMDADKGLKRFIALMLYEQGKLVDHMLEKNYSKEHNVKLYIHLMMDMEYAYQRYKPKRSVIGPYLDFSTKQQEEYEKHVKRSNGLLAGFISFDPSRPGSLDLVKRGLKRGNIGVKLYPPMGYNPNDSRFSMEFESLFDYCSDNDIPLLTHCTPVGFEAIEGWGKEYSHPDKWRDVLDQERWRNLRICFGHAGGGTYRVENSEYDEHDPHSEEYFDYYGWFAKNNSYWRDRDNYAWRVVKLCQEYPNVYCDFSYLHEILKGKQKEKFVKHLKSSLAEDGQYEFADKIMYGSDWHMAEVTGKTNKYLSVLKDTMQSISPDLPAKFFYKNALDYLHLDNFIGRQENGFFTDEALSHFRELSNGFS